MKLYICANGFTVEQLNQAKECVEKLERENHECSMSEELSQKLFHDRSHETFSAEECELIISLGGDGALLKAAKTAIKSEKKLIGINTGRLGYLCAMSLNELDDFDKIISGCKVSERKLLELKCEDISAYALNDIVVAKDNFGKTVDLKVDIEGLEEVMVRGDGVIICTPTGSTAYNLSAGGPRIDCDCDAIGMTPICAHDKNTYSRVIDGNKKIRISVNHETTRVYADGELIKETDQTVEVSRSDRVLKLCVR